MAAQLLFYVVLPRGFIQICSILVKPPFSLFSRRLVRVHAVKPYCSTDKVTAWKEELPL